MMMDPDCKVLGFRWMANILSSPGSASGSGSGSVERTEITLAVCGSQSVSQSVKLVDEMPDSRVI